MTLLISSPPLWYHFFSEGLHKDYGGHCGTSLDPGHHYISLHQCLASGLGFKKSNLVPSQRLQCIRMILNMKLSRAFLPLKGHKDKDIVYLYCLPRRCFFLWHLHCCNMVHDEHLYLSLGPRCPCQMLSIPGLSPPDSPWMSSSTHLQVWLSLLIFHRCHAQRPKRR